jgi:hypothetical protein
LILRLLVVGLQPIDDANIIDDGALVNIFFLEKVAGRIKRIIISCAHHRDTDDTVWGE